MQVYSFWKPIYVKQATNTCNGTGVRHKLAQWSSIIFVDSKQYTNIILLLAVGLPLAHS